MVDGVGWHPNGQVALTAEFIKGQRNGVWTYFDDQGNVTRRDRYDHGQVVAEPQPAESEDISDGTLLSAVIREVGESQFTSRSDAWCRVKAR